MSKDRSAEDTNKSADEIAAEIEAFGKELDWKARAQAAEAEVARLREALKWALPLAELKLSDTRQMRLQCGHNDINAGTNDVGLWPEEVAARERARQALNPETDK